MVKNVKTGSVKYTNVTGKIDTKLIIGENTSNNIINVQSVVFLIFITFVSIREAKAVITRLRGVC